MLHSLPDFNFLAFVFFATICSYSFHWYLTPDIITITSSRLKWLEKNRNVHAILFLAGLIGAFIYSLFLIKKWPWLLFSVFVTFLYSAPKIPHPFFRSLRKFALGKTVFLAFSWMYVTTILPIKVSGHEWQNDFYIFAASRFFFIYAICILFDYRDREYDRSIGIRSLITWLNERGIANLFAFSLFLFALSTLLMLRYDYDYLTISILFVPGIIVAILYKIATKNFSDTLYYFVLDGLMALSSLLTLLPGI
ncbi:MAG: UbiA family prenyltransferase [Chitinophagaceae bacterium]